MSRVAWSLLLIAFGCRSQSGADSANALAGSKPVSVQPALAQAGNAPSSVGQSSGEVATGGSSGATCPAEAPNIPHLETFMGVEMGQRYWVEMTFVANTWQPDPLIRPSYHHRSRLDLDNIDDFPALAHAQRARLTVQLTTSDISKVPDRYEWRSLFHARILHVCVLDSAR